MIHSHAKIIVLDRDGVINQDSDEFIKSPSEWLPLPGSLEAIAKLHQAGFTIVVATNQSGVGRGLFDLKMLGDIHQEMLARVTSAGGHIARIVFCPHRPEEHCDCRKPAPGMLYEIAESTGCGLGNMIVIGDAARDLQAARAAGSRPILVRTGKGRATETALAPDELIEVYDDLAAAAEALIGEAGIRK